LTKLGNNQFDFKNGGVFALFNTQRLCH